MCLVKRNDCFFNALFTFDLNQCLGSVSGFRIQGANILTKTVKKDYLKLPHLCIIFKFKPKNWRKKKKNNLKISWPGSLFSMADPHQNEMDPISTDLTFLLFCRASWKRWRGEGEGEEGGWRWRRRQGWNRRTSI